MPRTVRWAFAAVVVMLAGTPLRGQPTRVGPARPPSRAELDHLEAVKLYGLAAIQEKDNRLVEAARTLEAACRLDPQAAAPLKALVPIYFALDRGEDGLAGCRRVLELDPDDCETAYLYSRQLRTRGQAKEARAVLERAAASAALNERLELKAQICFDLGLLCEDAGDWEHAEKSFRRVAEVVDNPAALMEQGAYSREEIETRAAETYERLGRICLRAGHPRGPWSQGDCPHSPLHRSLQHPQLGRPPSQFATNSVATKVIPQLHHPLGSQVPLASPTCSRGRRNARCRLPSPHQPRPGGTHKVPKDYRN